MILHTVNSSPFNTHALKECLSNLAEQDSLLLLEDAVVVSQVQGEFFSVLKQLSEQGRLMILEEDAIARGITPAVGKLCSYNAFVLLAIGHKSQLAW